MELHNSSRSSISSANLSIDGINAQNLFSLSLNQYKTSQSLTSVINTTESSIIEYIYEYIYQSFTFGIEPSAILQDISREDFNPYLTKIDQYSSTSKSKEFKNNPIEDTDELNCAAIPKIFFSEDFKVESFLDENSLNQQELISTYLDIIDLKIFKKISYKWEEIMSTAFGLETLKEEIAEILKKIKEIFKKNKATQESLIKNYLKIIRLNRKKNNIKAVEEKLILMNKTKDFKATLNDLMNQGHYTSVTQLLLKTQQTLSSKLQGIKSLKECNFSLQKLKVSLSLQLDQEFSISVNQFIVINTFIHSEKLVKMLKSMTTLDIAFKLFPKESNYDRINELILNKINTSTLQQSLQDLNQTIINDIISNIKKLMSLLGVHKTDENSK